MEKVYSYFLRLALLGVGLVLFSAAQAHAFRGGWVGNAFGKQAWDGEAVVAESTVISENQKIRFVVNRNGQLIQFLSVDGSETVKHNLSRSFGVQKTFVDVKALVTDDGNVSAFVLNRQGDLEQFLWSALFGWQRHQITRDLRGPSMLTFKHVRYDGRRIRVWGYDRRHVDVRYTWTERGGWRDR